MLSTSPSAQASEDLRRRVGELNSWLNLVDDALTNRNQFSPQTKPHWRRSGRAVLQFQQPVARGLAWPLRLAIHDNSYDWRLQAQRRRPAIYPDHPAPESRQGAAIPLESGSFQSSGRARGDARSYSLRRFPQMSVPSPNLIGTST